MRRPVLLQEADARGVRAPERKVTAGGDDGAGGDCMGGNSDMRNAAQHEAPQEPPGPGELRRLHEALTALCDGPARSALSPQDWDYLDAGVRELAAAVTQYAFG